MKQPQTLEQLWKLPFSKRQYFYLSEDLMKGFPIQDSNEPLVNVTDFFTKHLGKIFYNPPADIQQIVPYPRLRETVTKKLFDASKKLPKGYFFSLSEGYRPFWYQKKNFDEIYADMKKQMKGASEKEVYDITTTYIADPSLCPPHTTGGAFDITIVDQHGKHIDMGAPMNTVGDVSHTFVAGLSKKAKENRQMLFDALTSEDFINLASEWWHYSYGDQYWAILRHEPFALYDSLDIKD